MQSSKISQQPQALHARVTMLRAAQVTKLLNISNATLWRWAKDPKRNFPRPVRIGPRVTAWSLGAIEAYIAQQVGSQDDA